MADQQRISLQHEDVPRGVIVIATLLVVVSLRLFYSEITDDGPIDSWTAAFSATPLVAVSKIAACLAGFIAAIALWNSSRRAFHWYMVWLVLFMTALFFIDSTVEPVAWKLTLGVALQAVLPIAGAAYLYPICREMSGA